MWIRYHFLPYNSNINTRYAKSCKHIKCEDVYWSLLESFFVLDYSFESSWETLPSFQAHGLYFQNQFLSHSWLLCHWSHQGHAPPSIVFCQQLPAEKWSFLSWRGIWTEIAWHDHLFGSCEYSQTATQSLLCSRACTMAKSYWTLIPQRCSEAQLRYTATVLYCT